MVNDDFMYSRRETPNPVFVEQLHARLTAQEELYKPKKKKGQPRKTWRYVAAIVSLIIVSISAVLTISPEARILVFEAMGVDMVLRAELENAHELIDFNMPRQIPDSFELHGVWTNYLNEMISIRFQWLGSKEFDYGNCFIRMYLFEHSRLPSVEQVEQTETNTDYLAERYDWIETFDINDDINAVWRLRTISNSLNMMEINWRIDGISYKLETHEGCVSREDFIAMAQSTN